MEILGPLLEGPFQIGLSHDTEINLRVLSFPLWPRLLFQITKISLTCTGKSSGFLTVKLMEVPDFVIDPWVMVSQPRTVGTGEGVVVGDGVIVGVSVMVGVKVRVGLDVAVGVRDGVNVNCKVFVGEGVSVG